MKTNTIYIGAAMILIGLVVLLRSFGLFESIESEVIYALGIMVIGGVLVMQRQK